MDRDFWKELFKIVFISVIIVVPFRLYVAQPFIVEGASMDPTFETGHYLIVDELTYRFKNPERGSVLVFHPPHEPKKSFIKRVIGLPGETVNIADGVITIINEAHPEGFVLDEPYVLSPKRESLSRTLGEKEYFVLGDNRISSADSRVWGPVPEDHIIGRPVIRLMPPSIFPGDNSNYKNE